MNSAEALPEILHRLHANQPMRSVAEEMGIPYRTVRDWIKRAGLRAVTVSDAKRPMVRYLDAVDREAVRDFLKKLRPTP